MTNNQVTYWTKEEFDFEVERTYKEMKDNGFNKATCKKIVKQMMKDNNISVKLSKADY